MDLNIRGLKLDAGKGAGSRGGVVIGRTSTGKPIYADKHPSHDKFSRHEHWQAEHAHQELEDRGGDNVRRAGSKYLHDKAVKEIRHHRRMAAHHRNAARKAPMVKGQNAFNYELEV